MSVYIIMIEHTYINFDLIFFVSSEVSVRFSITLPLFFSFCLSLTQGWDTPELGSKTERSATYCKHVRTTHWLYNRPRTLKFSK